jgi:hypothetical protein
MMLRTSLPASAQSRAFVRSFNGARCCGGFLAALTIARPLPADDEAAKIRILSYIDFIVTFAACWIIFFIAIMIFFFMPALNNKNADINTTRSMLLYLPVVVVARVKPILLLIDDILARQDQMGGSSRSVAPA